MTVPLRYRSDFIHQLGRSGYRGRNPRPDMWVCKRCGLCIRPNTAGAQSHIAKHVRNRMREQGQ